MSFIRLFLLFFFTAYSLTSFSQKLPTNSFDGFLSPENKEFSIELMFRISQENEELHTYLYVPEQFVFAEKSSKTILTNDSIYIEFSHLGIYYFAEIDKENNRLSGVWQHHKTKFYLEMFFRDDEHAIQFNRPQNPKESNDYFIIEQNIHLSDNQNLISGNLYLPDTINQYPLAIITKGGVAPERDYMFSGHRTFEVIADYLVKSGIAVFLFDVRGSGKSSGNFAENTTNTYVNDALEVHSYLKSNENINPEKIGFIGYSEGALIAFIAAAKNINHTAFIVALSSPAVNMIEFFKQQYKDLFYDNNLTEEKRQLLFDYSDKQYDMIAENLSKADFRKKLNALAEEYAAYFSEEEIRKYKINNVGAHHFLTKVYSPWLKYFLTIEPESIIQQLNCSVMALYGSKDILVNPIINSSAIENALKKSETDTYEVKVIEGLNNIFQPAYNGRMEEYMIIEETIDLSVLQKIYLFIYMNTK